MKEFFFPWKVTFLNSKEEFNISKKGGGLWDRLGVHHNLEASIYNPDDNCIRPLGTTKSNKQYTFKIIDIGILTSAIINRLNRDK